MRAVRDLPHAILDAEAAVHLHGVRALLQAGADAGELVGLLVHLGAKPRWCSAAATASPPMPAPMIAMRMTSPGMLGR